MSAPRDYASLAPGFADGPREAQALFRLILQAMARPGRLVDLSAAPPPPAGLDRAAAAIALTLVDAETPVWLGPRLAEGAIPDWLAFHCAAPRAATPAQAAFAFVDAAASPPLAAFALGEARYPDRSTTLVLICEALTGGAPVRLTGPGVKDAVTISPRGLADGFWTEWGDNRERFPLGVDAMLVAGGAMLGLPRTARAEPKGKG